MKKLFITLLLCASGSAFSTEKITLMLDWFVNPDHAAIIVAEQKGFFKKHNLDVEIIEPADPSLPPKLVATNKIDLAIDYQPQLQMQVDNGLPLMRIATLISTPLNTVITLEKSNIKTIADLKGKTIGFSVNGFEESLLATMLKNSGLSLNDVTLVNVNWAISTSLLTGKVDAVIGGLRNFELNQLMIEKEPGYAFYPEEHGVPPYDELIVVANKDKLADKAFLTKYDAFVSALEEAIIYTINHPDHAWELFQAYKPKELDNELNRMAWKDTLPRLTLRPRALDTGRYNKMAAFLLENKVIKAMPILTDYTTQISVHK